MLFLDFFKIQILEKFEIGNADLKISIFEQLVIALKINLLAFKYKIAIISIAKRL